MKKVLLRLIGPLTTAPNWFRRKRIDPRCEKSCAHPDVVPEKLEHASVELVFAWFQ